MKGVKYCLCKKQTLNPTLGWKVAIPSSSPTSLAWCHAFVELHVPPGLTRPAFPKGHMTQEPIFVHRCIE